MVPLQILISHLDVVKDVVLVIRLLQSIGWSLDPTQFSSVVIHPRLDIVNLDIVKSLI